MSIDKKETMKVYFPGLNALRFFAALAVLISHVELLKGIYGYPCIWNNPVIFELGGLGVVFFFVLSGFLITYLLIIEKEQKSTINLRKFYVRRLLRIWPLYYLATLLGFVILPFLASPSIQYKVSQFHENYFVNLVLFLFMMPNVAFSIFATVPHIGHLWSIGVEEQYYLLWPVIMKKSKRIFNILLTSFVLILLLKISVLLMIKMFDSLFFNYAARFLAMFKIESMLIGGAGAYLYYTKHKKYLSIVYHPIILILSILLIPTLIYNTPDYVQDAIHLLYSVAFIIIILNVSTNKRSFLKLNNAALNYAGKLSYGIYVYHMMIIAFVLLFLKSFYGMNYYTWNTIVYSLSIISSIIVAAISYEFLEKPFLKLKTKFQVIRSEG